MDATDSYRERFFESLIAMQPASVLDVGCGDGELLRRLTGHVARLSGVDTDTARVNVAHRSGLNVIRADALQLPFDDEEFDFVVGQYTAHHMRAAMPATAEALRVARRGAMMLDVWYDRSMPAQKNSARFDDWSKRIDGDNGEIHRPVQSLVDIAGPWLNAAGNRVAAEYWQVGDVVPFKEMESIAESKLLRSRHQKRDRREWEKIRGRALQTGFGIEGAIFVTILRR